MRYLFAPLRAVVILLHVAFGFALVLLVFPVVRQPSRNRIVHHWSRGVVNLFGAQLIVRGVALSALLRTTGVEAGTNGRLALANHVSWMDIFAINAATPCRFIAKAEIGRWPLLGTLVTRSGTLYIERGRRHAVAALNHTVREHLQAGETIVVFPEGTTTDGSALLPFHSNLIAPAIAADAPVWPIAIAYREGGQFTTAAAFVGDLTLAASMIRTLVARDLSIEITILPPIPTMQGSNRHAVARAARDAIARQLGLHDGESGMA